MNARLLLLPVLLLVGCDRFFRLQGRVTDCDTGRPLEAVAVRVTLDRGVREPPTTAVTDRDGVFAVGLNEPERAWVTVTLTRPGALPLSESVRGAPRGVWTRCLTAQPAR